MDYAQVVWFHVRDEANFESTRKTIDCLLDMQFCFQLLMSHIRCYMS